MSRNVNIQPCVYLSTIIPEYLTVETQDLSLISLHDQHPSSTSLFPYFIFFLSTKVCFRIVRLYGYSLQFPMLYELWLIFLFYGYMGRTHIILVARIFLFPFAATGSVRKWPEIYFPYVVSIRAMEGKLFPLMAKYITDVCSGKRTQAI